MNIGNRDLKLLWGRAASRCSMCGEQLSADKISSEGAYLIGEQAHIIGEKDDAPRGKSKLEEKKRNSYHNLILLCPTCHEKIDKNPGDYPVEELFILKSEHELKVEQSLSCLTIDSEAEVDKIVYGSLIDSTTKLCALDSWNIWLSGLNSHRMWLLDDLVEKLNSYTLKICTAIFPDENNGLDRSIKTLSFILNDILKIFFLHAEFDLDRDMWMGEKFYRHASNEQYVEEHEKFDKWQAKILDLSMNATQAINWFADEVRRVINPLFYTEEGKFFIKLENFEDAPYKVFWPEFSDEEKSNLPMQYKRVDEAEMEKYK